MDACGCPNLVSARVAWSGVPLVGQLRKWKIVIFIGLQVLASGSRIANTDIDLQFLPRRHAMLGELTTIPTHTLIDMLSVILADGEILTASDVDELEQIQRELQRRDKIDCSMLAGPN